MYKFHCRVCKSASFVPLFQWKLPLAAEVSDVPLNNDRYLLEPVVCKKCGHVQLRETLDVDMYKDYLYTPSFSGAFQEYIVSFVNGLDHLTGISGKRVIEIGSSNGYLLKLLMQKGWEVLGFEPSSVLASEAEQNGVQTERMYFGSTESLECVKKWGGLVDVVIMRHVLEHLDNLNDIIDMIGQIVQEGFLIIEVPWLLRIVKEKQFYAFFHEHLSYFSIRILQELVQKYGFQLVNIKENDLEGGSIVIYAYKGKTIHAEQETVYNYLESEKEWCTLEKLICFSKESEQQIVKMKNFVKKTNQEAKKAAVWGVGQRGVTLMNICGFDVSDIAYAIDINENYWWKYVPGTHIQVVPPSWLEEHFVESVIIFATGYADEIIADNKEYIDHGGNFLKIIDSSE